MNKLTRSVVAPRSQPCSERLDAAAAVFSEEKVPPHCRLSRLTGHIVIAVHCAENRRVLFFPRFFGGFFFRLARFALFFVSRLPRVYVRTPRKFAVTADHAYARTRIARVSLRPSVTVYSFRSYFVPVALKKSQSSRDKYACAPPMAGGATISRYASRQLPGR